MLEFQGYHHTGLLDQLLESYNLFFPGIHGDIDVEFLSYMWRNKPPSKIVLELRANKEEEGERETCEVVPPR